MFEICMSWPLGALPLGPHVPFYNFESPAPKDDSCQVWLRFQEEDETVTFYIGPPSPTCYPPQGPIGATLGTAMNNFYFSPNKVSTHYITWLFSLWIWRRRCLKFTVLALGGPPPGPTWGHTYYLNNFESPTPKEDSCQVWLKSNHAFSRRMMKNNVKSLQTTHDGRSTDKNGRQ